MIVKVPNVSAGVQAKNHRQPSVVKALRWFWRFSQFYGEYAVRAPQERQSWANQQRAQLPSE